MSLPKRSLGKTGIDVSCLGLGTVKLGRNQEVKYPAGFALPEDREVLALLDQAKSLGINLLDTAPAYGSSEQRLGRLLSNRTDWVICSKVGEEFNNGKSFYNFSAEHVQFSVERSLRNINTDYLDCILIHSDGRDQQIIENSDCIETLLRLKEKGMIRSFGMSTKTVAGGLLAAELMDVVMVTYNPSATEEESVIEAAESAGKGVLIKKALNSGHDCADPRLPDHPIARNMRFIFARPGVSSIIIGTINTQHLQENVTHAEASCKDDL